MYVGLQRLAGEESYGQLGGPPLRVLPLPQGLPGPLRPRKLLIPQQNYEGKTHVVTFKEL